MSADNATGKIPLIVRWPGITDTQKNRAYNAVHCHVDAAATILELAGAKVPESWDGVSLADALKSGKDEGRVYTVISHMAGSCQRSVRFDDFLFIRSYHDGYHCFPDRMLFDVKNDPHMMKNIASSRKDTLGEAAILLDDWYGEMLKTATYAQDPLWSVMIAGGPEHTRNGSFVGYLKHLKTTGRTKWADYLASRHPRGSTEE